MHIRRFAPALLLALAAACTPARPSALPAPAQTPAAVSLSSAAQPAVAAALDSIFNDTAFASAHWGVLVRSLESGQTLYARNAGKMFVPASNMKIVTAAAALEALGPDYRYLTRVAASGPVRDGVLQGDLIVHGSGDPTISERFHGDVRTVFRAWADSLRAHGVRRITGAVIGNDDVFDDLPLGRGWAWDDVADSYSAEVGGLQLNEGFVTVLVTPVPGQRAAAVTTRPVSDEWVPVAGNVWMAPADSAPRITVDRADSLGAVAVSGTLPADTTYQQEVSVRNNTRFFASVLRQALLEAGIGVRGQSLDADDDPARGKPAATTPLFTHTSAPMREILAAFMKPSQNQIGELLLKTLGRELRGQGTARAGAAAIDSMAAAWGLPRRLLAQADGSGLSRYNLVAPEFLVALLEREARSPHFGAFHDALPVAGRDGTLAARMRGTPAAGNVHAKTGTLSGVRSLSGYFTTAAGERMVFSMMVNHHTLGARDADRLAEAALMRLIALDRRTRP
ncbi:MAG TPA: D-alanyl-D-alanine carboxypeptidase/D-alanyl-D-alanine-endopeptidase [Longimicrobium sp.]|jgi:D-alanyl-D-alanine carboxypeptidase/D-alanyl-D-alanine-endopeptidase (penicillin-binding protein 4)|uniref:D-alanyl-D-alanine carboxypeptidase/D-alanyl-D-alanine endopeptidase n=1 Tax=Longimicrobium sp. TaxID=2029185 RepID=UPI002EDA95F1